ncbi:MAG: ABC transporter ATP-binding protein [Geminicoccaceae bacterium]
MSVAVDVLGAAKTFGDGPDAVHAFGPLDLAIEAGSFVALLGPSGCGKSTLLMMIAGLLAGSSGEIRLAGAPVRGPQTDIGIVFQSHVLVDWRDVLGNVLLQIDLRGLRRDDYLARANELLSSVGLEQFVARRPYELSGGMQQRTAFCRALVHDPPLVLMDEPLGALDAMTREQLRADLERLWLATGKTVILVTHSIEEAVQLADKVVVISPRPGRVVREIAIDLARPRNLEVCETPAFHAHVAEIKRIFSSYGVI